MEQYRGRKGNEHKEPRKDHQEIGVCGTGKHRVININPLLLTPSSASKIYPGSAKKTGKGKKRKCDLDSTQLRQSLTANPLSINPTTTDDSSSIAGSDVTDISELSSIGAGVEYRMHENIPNNFQRTISPAGNLFDGTEQYTRPRRSLSMPLPIAKRERVIEISPSLMLPVTAMPSKSHTADSNLSLPFGRNASDAESRRYSANALSTSSSRTSLSDITSSRLSVTEDTDGISTFSEQDSCVHVPGDNLGDLQTECERLKQALKLADADIAILVSSKQQITLDFHNEKDKVKTLSRIIFEVEEKNKNSKTVIEQLRSSIQEQKEQSNSDLETYRSEIDLTKSALAATRNSLDVAVAERDSRKLEIKHLKQNLETFEMKLKRSETELVEVVEKNVRLSSLIEEASVKDEGTESFIKHIKQERKDVATKLQQRENECTMLQVANKSLESRVVDLQHTNQILSEKSTKHETRFREVDSENVMLSSRLQAATREKMDLNGAVVRLRSDLAKVESTFSRLKQQMMEKSLLVERESTRRAELEGDVKSLSVQVAKLNNVNAETRIRDKNVQIEQLLTKSKLSTSDKTKLEKQVEKLEQHIASNEKSWTDAIEKETQALRLQREKDDLLAVKSKEIETISVALKKEQRRTEELTRASMSSEEMMRRWKEKVTESEKIIEKIVKEKNSVSDMVDELRKQLHFEKEERETIETFRVDESSRLQREIQCLNDEVETLQKAVISKDDELGSLRNPGKTSEKQAGDHSIQQLQLLSELQSARRELCHDKEVLMLENNKLKANAESVEREIREIEKKFAEGKEQHEEEIASLRECMATEKKNLESDVLTLERKLNQGERSNSQMKEEMLMVKDNNNVLSQQLGALQIHKGKLAEDLKNKIQENEEITSQQKAEKEAMELLKQELSSVTLRLTDALREAENHEEKYVEFENLLRERNLLQSAVIRQQEYCTSLQKHYEKWAEEAALKMRAEIARYKNNLVDQRSRHTESIGDFSDGLGSRVTRNTEPITNHRNQIAMTFPEDGDARKISSEELLTSNPEYKKELQKRNDNCTQTEHDTDLCSACEHSRKVVIDIMDSSAQTDHDAEYVDRTYEVETDKENNTNFLIGEQLRLIEENTEQAELIVTLEERMQNWSMSDCAVLEDSSTQTLHDDDLMSVLSESVARSSPLLEDSSSQTEHGGDLVGHTSAAQLEEEILALKDFSNRRIAELLRQNSALGMQVMELEEELKHLKMKVDCHSSSSQTVHDLEEVSLIAAPTLNLRTLSTQTDHDVDPACVVRSAYLTSEAISTQCSLPSTVMEESASQTDHDLEPLVSCGVPTAPICPDPIVAPTTNNPCNVPHSTQTDHDLNPVFSHRVKPPVLESLSTQTPVTLPALQVASTQTASLSYPMACGTAAGRECVSASCQTDHDGEVLVHFGNEVSRLDWESVREENEKLKLELALATDTLQDLKDEQTSMLEDSGTQTSHDEVAVGSASPVHAPREVSSSLLQDSSTQTGRESDCIFPGNSNHALVMEELELARGEVARLSLRLQNVVLDNQRLNAAFIERVNLLERLREDCGSQTSHEADLATTSPTVAQPQTSTTTEAASCQTDHNLQTVDSRSLVNGDAWQERAHKDMSLGEPCRACGRSFATSGTPDSGLPSPMLILHTMESKKLKAYKKTVHLLKKKLESAEEKFANLQAESKIPPPPVLHASTEPSANLGMDTLKTAQEELYQVRKTASVQVEQFKRKALAERKISESKISNMLERISGLTNANEQLRNSVQVLQVKLAEKSKQGSIAIKEKIRYQMRARRLQASLRSLAWIPGSQDKDLPDGSLDDGSLLSGTLSESTEIESSQVDAGPSKHSSTLKSVLSLPASVVEIEASLKDLQSEIIALEKQMQEHNSAVKQSKTQWTRFKEESRVLTSSRPPSDKI